MTYTNRIKLIHSSDLIIILIFTKKKKKKSNCLFLNLEL